MIKLRNNRPIWSQGGYFLLLWESTIETIKVPTVAIAMISWNKSDHVTAFSICSTPFLGAGLTAYRLWYALWLLLYQIGLFSSNYFCHFVAILFDTSRFLLYNIGIEHTDKRSLPKCSVRNNRPIGKQGGYFLFLYAFTTISTLQTAITNWKNPSHVICVTPISGSRIDRLPFVVCSMAFIISNRTFFVKLFLLFCSYSIWRKPFSTV